jgi:hypothetical protein
VSTVSLPRKPTRAGILALWRDLIGRTAGLTRLDRLFAVAVLGPLMVRGNRICPDRQRDLISRYAEQRGRRLVTGRRIQQLLARLIGAGVLARGPGGYRGRAATYIAVIPELPPAGVWRVRPRGVTPRRLHASFAREASAAVPPPGPAPPLPAITIT